MAGIFGAGGGSGNSNNGDGSGSGSRGGGGGRGRRKQNYASRAAREMAADCEITDTDMAVPEEEWRIPAKDGRGRYSTYKLMMPQQLLEAVEIAVASGLTPYADVGEFMRHALVRNLEMVNRRCADHTAPKHLLLSLKEMSQTLHYTERKTQAAGAIIRLDKLVGRQLADGERAEAYKLLLEMTQMIEAIPGTTTRDRMRKSFYAKYGSFLNSGGMVAPTEHQLWAGNLSPEAQKSVFSFGDSSGTGSGSGDLDYPDTDLVH